MGAKRNGTKYKYITGTTYGTLSYRTIENYIDDYAANNGFINCANLVNIAASAGTGAKGRLVMSKAVGNAMVKAGSWYVAAGITAASFIIGSYYAHQRNTVLAWKRSMASNNCDRCRVKTEIHDVGLLQGASTTRTYTETKHIFQILDKRGNVVESLYDYIYS